MKYRFGYGQGYQEISFPEQNLLGVLLPKPIADAPSQTTLLKEALKQPVGLPRLKEIVRAGERIVIVTSDITRPVPSFEILPPLLDELYAAGIKKQDITIVFGLGSHRKQTPAEHKALVGEAVYHEICCMDSDADDCMRMGITSRGTPVDISRTVAEADRRILIGNIEYHYFAGFSGGYKALMPGVSSREAIQSNHSRMVSKDAFAGKLDHNPVREDIDEAGRICGADFILNVILDEHKKIIYAVAGDPVHAHRAGCKRLHEMYACDIQELADIVVVSQGGAPKDINLYQTQKALDNAKHAVKKGGIIILIGACNEGLGEEVFERWMTQSPSAAHMVNRIAHDFQLGGHKAAAIGMVLENADIYLVSNMEPHFVQSIFLSPFSSAQQALDQAFFKRGQNAKLILMPYGGSTLPRLAIN